VAWMNRRQFFSQSVKLCGAGTALGLSLGSNTGAADKENRDLVEAKHYQKLPNRKIKCVLCPRECVIDDLETGYCGVRENHGGTYYTLVHSRPCSAHIDPIEKKPLFHFLPGTEAFSIATVGCNVLCKFCQNWEISQARPDQAQSYELTPEKVAQYAITNNCASIAYTYTEPVVFFEYMYDCAQAGQQRNIKSVMISNGYIQAEPMRELIKVVDAVKVDLKAFTEGFYEKVVAGRLKPVLDTLVLLKNENSWTEIVYLVIPTLNDDPNEIRQMSKWIKAELGADVPLHFSRFYPVYRLKNLPPTPTSTLDRARNIAMEAGLNYVYIGNIPGHEGESTFCPNCKKIVVRRIGYQILENNLKKPGLCKFCQQKIAGVW